MKVIYFLPVLLLCGCATVSTSGDREARQNVAARTGYLMSSERSIDETVTTLLANPITPDSAAQIALLNNKELAADFEDIGIAQADWVEAGLLRNPALSLAFGIPTSPPSATRIEASFTQSFIELLTLPRRKKIAEAQYAAVKLRVAEKALSLVAETKSKVYELQAQAQLMKRLEAALELEQASSELAQLQHDAGNIADLELARRKASYVELRLEIARVRTAGFNERQKLNRLLGLWKTDTWVVDANLAEIPDEKLTFERLESVAIEQRLDISAAKADYAANARVLGLAADYRFLGTLDVGAQFERDVDGQKTIGPTIGLEIPLFNRGSARQAKAKAQLRQTALRLEALAADTRLEVRQTLAELAAARDVATYFHGTVIPGQRQLLSLTQQRYNGMFVGAYDLVAVKQSELAAERGEIEARRDYWEAMANLEKAVGGSLTMNKNKTLSKP